MSASCTFLFFWLAMGVRCWVQTFVVHMGHPPHNIIHLHSMNIMSIFHGLVCHRATSVARGDLKNSRHMMCFFTLCSRCTSLVTVVIVVVVVIAVAMWEPRCVVASSPCLLLCRHHGRHSCLCHSRRHRRQRQRSAAVVLASIVNARGSPSLRCC